VRASTTGEEEESIRLVGVCVSENVPINSVAETVEHKDCTEMEHMVTHVIGTVTY